MDERSRRATSVRGDDCAAQRQASAELNEHDEEPLAENIALQNGTRVEEYQKRIAHQSAQKT